MHPAGRAGCIQMKKGGLRLLAILADEVVPFPAHVHAEDNDQGQQGQGKEYLHSDSSFRRYHTSNPRKCT
jgi:hypothetical protein